MSIVAIGWAFRLDIKSPITKFVLVKLADNANDEGRCWPSIKTIGQQTSLSHDAVIRHIKKLKELGIIDVIHRNDGTASLSNVYQLNLTERPPVADDERVVADDERGSSCKRLGVVADDDTNRNIEPSIESIYAEYPKKVGKPKALLSIKKALEKIDFNTLLEKTRDYAAARKGSDPNYTPHPTTWFNQERYNDDPSTWVEKPFERQIDPLNRYSL